MTSQAPRGRPRSQAARRAVLDAALRLCLRDGYRGLTVKGIADAAGVGRQTIYRWWPAKSDVLLEALRDLAERDAAELSPDTGDTRRDLRTLLSATFALAGGPIGPALAGLLGDAQSDPDLAERLQRSLLAPRRANLRTLLARGTARGDFRPDADLDLAVDVVFGVMWYRLLSGHAPLDGQLAEELTSTVTALLG